MMSSVTFSPGIDGRNASMSSMKRIVGIPRGFFPVMRCFVMSRFSFAASALEALLLSSSSTGAFSSDAIFGSGALARSAAAIEAPRAMPTLL